MRAAEAFNDDGHSPGYVRNELDKARASLSVIRLQLLEHPLEGIPECEGLRAEVMTLKERVKALEELRSPLYDRAQRYHENDDFIDPRDM